MSEATAPRVHDPGTGSREARLMGSASIRETLELLMRPGDVHEIRVVKAGGRRTRTISGYFGDLDAMAAAAADLDAQGHPAIYLTLNPVNAALLARASNRLEDWAQITTADHDVASRRWIPLDLDPVRPAGISATDAEHDAALARLEDVEAFLGERGIPLVLADSGNGAWGLIPIDLPNTEESRTLVQRVLESLAERFDDGLVKIDTSVHNAARIAKLFGTLTRKGDDTPERPWRRSRIISRPSELTPVSVETLETLTGPQKAKPNGHATARVDFDLAAWLGKHGVELRRAEPKTHSNGSEVWELAQCPFNPDHSQGEAFVGRRATGELFAGCQHDSCSWGWRELRERFETGHGSRRAKPERAGAPPAGALRRTEHADAADEEPAPQRSVDLEKIAFSGDRLLGLLDRPTPDPVVAGIPTPGHLTVMVAPSFTGKTSLELVLAMARAAGVAPWAGAPMRPAGRVLIFSLDEAPEQVVRRMRSLSTFHPAGQLERFAGNLEVIGPDRDVNPEALDALRFDFRGLAILAAWIERAEQERRPFVEIYIDAYADVIPFGDSENSNEVGTMIGGALERLAVSHGPAVQLLHHAGKPKVDAGEDLPDLRYLGRGASSLAAKARVLMSVERVPGMNHVRRIRTVTNLSRTPKPALFEVCGADTEDEEILFFRPHDPASAYSPRDYLGTEAITTTALAWALARKEPEAGRRPPGEFNRLAGELRDEWRRAGLIEVFDGPRNAKMIRLVGVESGGETSERS